MKLNEIKSTGRSVADLNIEYSGGSFSCFNKKLTSLAGAPSHVSGSFLCSDNKLTSLVGAPSRISGSFSCFSNQLTSLKGAPSHVGGDFSCFSNQLTSLKGAPSHVGGSFSCFSNQLTSLKDVHKQIRSCKCFDVSENAITSHVLGLLLIKELKEVKLDNKHVESIINSYLPSRGMIDVLKAQEELIMVGLDEYAQL